MNSLFPYTSEVPIGDRSFLPSECIKRLSSFFKEPRLERLKEIALARTYHFSVVTENLYDTGNINAIMRTSENFGIQPFHIVESVNTHISQRTTKGAEKWIDQWRWENTEECFLKLREQGYQIVSTTLSDTAKSFLDVDYTQPTAIVFGNEATGISEYAQKHSDHHVIIPTVGFSQSFNVSVAASILIGKLMLSQKWDPHMNENEKERLYAEFVLRDFLSTKGGKKMLPRLF